MRERFAQSNLCRANCFLQMRSKTEHFTDKSRCVGRICEENYTLDQRNSQRLILLFLYRRQNMYDNLQFWLLHLSKVSFTRAQLYILHLTISICLRQVPFVRRRVVKT